MSLSAFAPTNYGSFTAQSNANGSRAALPGGGGATLLVTNMGPSPAALKLGDNTVTCSGSNDGVVVMPGQSIALTVGSATNIAASAVGYGGAQLNMAQGT